MESKCLKSLNKKISKDRIIKNKDDEYYCKFCKSHPDDCFCNDDAKIELKGYNKGFIDGKKFALQKQSEVKG